PPLAHDLLTNERLSPPDRMTALSRRALSFLDASCGTENEHLRASLRRFVRLPFEQLLPEPSARPEAYVEHRLRETDPDRCALAGEESVARLSNLAVRTARPAGLSEHRGSALAGGLMLYLGSGFTKDPWHPWAADAWRGLSTAPENARERWLHATIVRHV